MGFHEVQFPTAISYGSSGGPGMSTAILEMDSGAEERVARWSNARRKYNVAYGLKSKDDLGELITFYIARLGPAYGFRYKDWLDFTTASDHRSTPDDGDVQIGTGDGSETQFQLIKKYTSGGVTRTRNITKPVTGTTVIAIDGAAQESGWSVNTVTGIVTVDSAPAEGEVVSAGCEFDVPVRFGRELDELLPLSLEAFDVGSVSDIPIVEIRDEGEIQDEFFFGGSVTLTITSNTEITVQTGRVIRVTCNAGNKLILPATTNLPTGGPYFYVICTGSNNLVITNQADDTICTLTPGDVAIILLYLDGATKTWFGVV